MADIKHNFIGNCDTNNKDIIFIKLEEKYYCFTFSELNSILTYKIPEYKIDINYPIVYYSKNFVDESKEKERWIYKFPYENIYIDSSIRRLFDKGCNTYELTKHNNIKKELIKHVSYNNIGISELYYAFPISRCNIMNIPTCYRYNFYKPDYKHLSAVQLHRFKKKILQKIGYPNYIQEYINLIKKAYNNEIPAHTQIEQKILEQLNYRSIFAELSRNPNVTWDIIRENLTFNDGKAIPWTSIGVSMNPNITFEIFQNLPVELKSWEGFSSNININAAIINEYKNYLSSSNLASNLSITWDIVKANPDIKWDSEYEMLSGNSNITFDIVKNNPNIPWDYDWLSLNPNITWDIVKDNPEEDWSYEMLSQNPNITWDIVKNNPNIPWDYGMLSDNITWEIARDNPDKDWNYMILSSNPNITWDIVKANPDKGWDYDNLFQNPVISQTIIQDNKHLLHDHVESLCNNPNLTLPFLSSMFYPGLIIKYYAGNKGGYDDFVFEKEYNSFTELYKLRYRLDTNPNSVKNKEFREGFTGDLGEKNLLAEIYSYIPK